VTHPIHEELAKRAEAYVQSRELSIDLQYPLGSGIDGCVWRTSRASALKLCERLKNYQDEAECYRRCRIAGVDRIQGFAVPKLIDADDSLMAIEMSIVRRPFLLDFGKVYLDIPPPYWDDAEIMANWHAEGREHFGEQWKAVLSLIRILESYGIYYVDPKPGNVMFGDESA
jgi:hypothetical protein